MTAAPAWTLADLLDAQRGVVARDQLRRLGWSDAGIRAHVATGRWRRIDRGVVVAQTGPLTYEQRCWAALLRAGRAAVLSHESAAYLDGLLADQPTSVHVSVPHGRQARAGAGTVVHRSRHLAERAHPAATPPRTRVEHTVLDMVDNAADVAAAISRVASACQRRRTTAARLRAALLARPRNRWRAALLPVLDDVARGVHSLLELRYLHRVERAHGLPEGRRQRRVRAGRRTEWTDVSYDDVGVLVELDGRLGHTETADRWRDYRRDNAAAERAELALRYGWADVEGQPCEVAGQVARVRRTHGWTGRPRPCGPHCPLG